MNTFSLITKIGDTFGTVGSIIATMGCVMWLPGTCRNRRSTGHGVPVTVGGLAGSASFAAAIRASELGKTVAMIERETLVNVGCPPECKV